MSKKRSKSTPIEVDPKHGYPEYPDNEAFWKAVNAVRIKCDNRGRRPNLTLRRAVYLAVAYFVSLTYERVCFNEVAMIAKRANVGTITTREHLTRLERDGYLVVSDSRMRPGIRRYGLTLADARPEKGVVERHSGNAYMALESELLARGLTALRESSPWHASDRDT